MISDLMLPPYWSTHNESNSTGVFLACLVPALLLAVLLVPPIVASNSGPDQPTTSVPAQGVTYTLIDPHTAIQLTVANDALGTPVVIAPVGVTDGAALCWAIAYNQLFYPGLASWSRPARPAEMFDTGPDEAVLLCRE